MRLLSEMNLDAGKYKVFLWKETGKSEWEVFKILRSQNQNI